MSTRIHIIGTMCSGKTIVIEKTRETFHLLESWDIKTNFYLPERIIVNDKFNWDRYEVKAHLIGKRIETFIEENERSPIVIESSGFNTRINMAVKNKNFKLIVLNSPSRKELKRRAEKRGDSIDKVYDFALKYNEHIQKIKKFIPEPISQDEAIEEMKRIIKSSKEQRREG